MMLMPVLPKNRSIRTTSGREHSRDVPAAEGDLFFPRLVGVKPGCNPVQQVDGGGAYSSVRH
jgi:hypothetical protein